MKCQLLSLNIGVPKIYSFNGKQLHTGFIKESQDESIWLSKIGFEGDGQADQKNHGGEDKALLMYSYHHYNYWEKRYNREFNVPSFGENVTINHLSEDQIHLGDIFALGNAIVQVSQPRNPCYKIAEVHQLKDIPAVVTETGYSGYYFRVLREGFVTNNDYLELIEKDPNEISISFVHQTLFHLKDDIERINTILKVEAIATSLRKTLENRLDKLTV
ncbi:MOSC domain-containing protein [Aquibacillus halophilus]|uniref:MOSC domain-containing protein n=1 Tax=Aquibacillus halophilus TaxID=930132 RepID=A0A6A8DG00_9BACI|nr:MOSC domain-containing protein [Aquibacillus halophilus]MRH44608.1 MOSC domain-containing protein [Aquibacillus halophilus]